MTGFLGTLNTVDLAAVILIAACAVHGGLRGLSAELAGLLAIGVTLVLGLRFFGPLADAFLAHSRVTGPGAHSLAFVCVCVAAFLFMLAARMLFKRVLRVVVEEDAERLGGAIAGTVRGVLIVAVLFVVMNLLPAPSLNRMFGEESVIGSVLLRALPEVRERTPGAGADTDRTE